MLHSYGELYRTLGPAGYLGMCAAIAALWAIFALRRR